MATLTKADQKTLGYIRAYEVLYHSGELRNIRSIPMLVIEALYHEHFTVQWAAIKALKGVPETQEHRQEALIKLLDSHDSLILSAAIQELGNINHSTVNERLEHMLQQHVTNPVLLAILQAHQNRPLTEGARKKVLSLIESDASLEVRVQAVLALQGEVNHEVGSILLNILDNGELHELWDAALQVLSAHADRYPLSLRLSDLLVHDSQQVRRIAIQALATQKSKEVTRLFARCYEDEPVELNRLLIVQALATSVDEVSMNTRIAALADLRPSVRLAAAQSFHDDARSQVTDALIRHIGDSDPEVGAAITDALRFKHRKHGDQLRSFLQ